MSCFQVWDLPVTLICSQMLTACGMNVGPSWKLSPAFGFQRSFWVFDFGFSGPGSQSALGGGRGEGGEGGKGGGKGGAGGKERGGGFADFRRKHKPLNKATPTNPHP